MLQPLDAGINSNFKVHYRRGLVQKMLDNFDQGKSAQVILKDAFAAIHDAWAIVSATNCWKHTGILATEADSGI